MKTFSGLTDKDLEDWFKVFFTSELGFDQYFATPGQIELRALDAKIPKGHHLEIDGVCLINKTCILFEYTSQGGEFRDKIKKFTRNCSLFVESASLTLREKFELFKIPKDKIEDFEEIEQWKYVYIGTHPDFDLKNYSRGDFPDYPSIQKLLYIFQPSQIEYLRQLTNLIGKFGGNDLLAALDFTPQELGDTEESIHLDFIKADGKYITGDTKADIYLVKFTIDQLLRIARVSRYEGIPFILEGENAGENYQRLLIDKKLSDISKNFIGGNKRKTFPNTITIALSNDCREQEIDGKWKLTIPKKFSSIDIIDGQHRLYGYTQADVSDPVRQHAEILASAIKFKTEDQRVIGKSAAKVFCEINSTQAIVKKELLYLIKYDVLGDTDIIALAGKTLLECDTRGGGALAGIFLISSLRRRNRLNLPCIPITNIIDLELAPFINGQGLDGYIANDADFKRVFNAEREFLTLNPEVFYKSTVYILELFFKDIKNTFVFDWKTNADTHLITEGYFCAFLRLLRKEMYNNQKTLDELLGVLQNLKESIDTIITPDKSPTFPRNNAALPDSAAETDKIFSFILQHLNSKANDGSAV